MLTLISPARTHVRIVDGEVVLADLGPAMGRTPAFAHQVVRHNKAILDAHVRKTRVDNRTGWVMAPAGVVEFAKIMSQSRDLSGANKDAREDFIKWAKGTLAPAMKKAPAPAKPQDSVSRVVVDFRKSAITVERMDGTTTTVSF